MKPAEALQERADLNTKISELRSRLCDNAIVQEGEKHAHFYYRALFAGRGLGQGTFYKGAKL